MIFKIITSVTIASEITILMTLYEFNLLNESDQCQTVWDNGTYLDVVTQDGIKMVLYAIDKFFVEVHYDSESNKIVGLKSFKHGQILDKYSGDITF
ncbi:hypothetical protein ACFQ1O_04360 [Pseudofulvibacter geojedonensis]|uniref:Uncharacterized protein n=1 Tax=Pseudofulvibacter geojedonensis TaxID=1123758 RepID=A0ABW3I0C8_9FLAO